MAAIKIDFLNMVEDIINLDPKTGSKLGKECEKAVYCHPAYLTYRQSTS